MAFVHGKFEHYTHVKRSWNDTGEWVAVCDCGAIMVAHSEEAAERAGHNHEQEPTVYAQLSTDDWSGCCV
jgi:hypothetical protein